MRNVTLIAALVLCNSYTLRAAERWVVVKNGDPRTYADVLSALQSTNRSDVTDWMTVSDAAIHSAHVLSISDSGYRPFRITEPARVPLRRIPIPPPIRPRRPPPAIPKPAPGDLPEAPKAFPTITFINSCQVITKPGHYVLAANLVDQAPCLFIHDTQDVTLDCEYQNKNYTITSSQPDRAIDIANVKRLVIQNCTIQRQPSDWTWPGPSAPRAFPPPSLKIVNSDSVQVIGSAIGRTYAENATRTRLAGDDISGGYTQFHSFQTLFENNTVHHPDSIRPIVWFQDGSSNYILRNTIDGEVKYTPPPPNCPPLVCPTGLSGADDGLILFDENSDVAAGNTIRNTYDAGIESVGLLKDTQILQNIIHNCLNAGISTYWGSSWVGNRVADNHIDNTYRMIWFTYAGNSYVEHPIVHFYFQNNTIENNVFRQPTDPFLPSAAVDATFAYALYAGYGQSDISVSNNLVQRNDFGMTSAAPYFGPQQAAPPPAFIDGGGNICPPAVPASAITCHPPSDQNRS